MLYDSPPNTNAPFDSGRKCWQKIFYEKRFMENALLSHVWLRQENTDTIQIYKKNTPSWENNKNTLFRIQFLF